MGQSDDIEDSTYSRHQDLCQKLNMDATSASEAWRSYESIRQNYTLEGDPIHWIGCALYVACRKSSTPTVGKGGANVEGNWVSLTRLLRLCNLPLLEFFTKSKAWADMANMPQDFRFKIEKLERNFAVSKNIFNKYQPIFEDIFKNPADSMQPARLRRHKNLPCTPSRVKEFCWSLFVCIKGTIPAISDDLVNSYHLLLVCCDLMYSNALLSDRRDLLNPDFPGLPANFNEENYTPPDTANCIVELLCNRHDAIAVEAMGIKEHIFKNYLNKLFNDQVLRGEQSSFSDILETLNFDGNCKAVNKLYEQHVLSVGDFDERIFLGENANSNIGSPRRLDNVGDLQEQFQARRASDGGMQNSAPPTPLTGRKYLRTRDTSSIAPVSSATQGVNRLNRLLKGHQGSASEGLLEIFNSCSRDVKTLIETKVKEIGELFCAKYTQNTVEMERSLDFGKNRFLMAQTLFYKLLEMILKDEKNKKPNFDITNLMTNEVFVQCLFACCLEIVIYSYKNEDKTFPWILHALNIEAYYFYKVIEITVKVEEQLSRDVVKHLNCIEEKILESLAWQKNSPLWQAIESTEGGVPCCEEVSLPGSFDSIDPNTSGHPVLRRIALDRGAHYDVPQSPISSASERFQSPVAASGIAKKQLFVDNKISGHSLLRVGGQSLLSSKIPSLDGNLRMYIAVPEQTSTPKISTSVSPPTTLNRESARSRRTGSVALFFRKFYNLAAVRMHDLCHNLSIDEEDLKKKIWTIFEYSIKETTHLMRDRHLDQILMCAVYVICKLAKIEKNSFTEIMRCYRLQPQAESHIYRSVLIDEISRNENDTTTEAENGLTGQVNNAAPPTPSNMAGTSQNFGTEIRGDLIKFYNTVYVPPVKEFANSLGVGRRNLTNLPLSPLPRGKSTKNSPIRRITGSVTTRMLDPKAITASPAPTLSYCLGRSPAKDLEAINKMVISVDARKAVGKRLLSDDTDVEMAQEPIKKAMTTTFVARKLENILDDRRIQNQ